MRAVMESFGIQISDFQFVTELPSRDAIIELCAGHIDATALTSWAIPTPPLPAHSMNAMPCSFRLAGPRSSV